MFQRERRGLVVVVVVVVVVNSKHTALYIQLFEYSQTEFIRLDKLQRNTDISDLNIH
jgi:hypothetical protein